MKTVFASLVVGALTLNGTAQTTHELTNIGNTFSPALITMQAGDSIHLVLAATHTCTQVDEATWNSNGNSSNGGFDYGSGEVTFALDEPGTYYYVCIPHATMGMKGRFIVEGTTAVQEAVAGTHVQIAPNPADATVRITGTVPGQLVRVVNMEGDMVLEADPDQDGLLDTSALANGAYGVQICNSDGSLAATGRLVVAR